jgi:uncharacterized protein (TIGR03084 family)
MKPICDDLKNEQEVLEVVVANLGEQQWMTMTPSPGWNIKDQIRHLAYFDDRGALAAGDPEAFGRHLEEISKDSGAFLKTRDEAGRELSTAALLTWWRQMRVKMIEALAGHHPKDRLPWYGPPMSALSFATARLMETWAHGQDVFDALRLKRTPTERIRHIAHLGVSTFGWSYINRGLERPQIQIRVELTSPAGDLWIWGPEGASEKITGPAEDFCLIVTQRRHLDDTRLNVAGEAVRDWMLKAQCFAGRATDGPQAGERVW